MSFFGKYNKEGFGAIADITKDFYRSASHDNVGIIFSPIWVPLLVATSTVAGVVIVASSPFVAIGHGIHQGIEKHKENKEDKRSHIHLGCF